MNITVIIVTAMICATIAFCWLGRNGFYIGPADSDPNRVEKKK